MGSPLCIANQAFLRWRGDIIRGLLFSLALVFDTIDDRIFDIQIKSIGQVDVLTRAEAHIRKINEHHYELVLSDALTFSNIKHLVNDVIKLALLTP
jgi:hypothetical protein